MNARETGNLRRSIEERIPDLLGSTAFLFADPVSCLEPDPGWAVARIEVGGDVEGFFEVMACPRLQTVLVANMLGIDEDDPDLGRRTGDALGEFLNIAVGHLLTDCWGDNLRVTIGIPRTSAMDSATTENPAEVCAAFDVEGAGLVVVASACRCAS